MKPSRRDSKIAIGVVSVLVVIAIAALLVRRATDPGGATVNSVACNNQRLTWVASDTRTTLRSVTALSQQDAWAAGVNGKNAALMHWNGHKWDHVALPTIATNLSALNSIGAVNPQDVWAVGSADLHPLILHWNGDTWAQVDAPSDTVYSSQFSTLATVSADDIWAMGNALSAPNSTPFTIAEHWDGRSWQIATAPHGSAVDALTVNSDGSVWALITTAENTGQIVRWDGSAWHEQPGPDIGLAANSIQTIAADKDGVIWVAGGWEPAGENWPVPFVARWDGKTWTRASTSATESRGAWFTHLAVGNDGTVWAAGTLQNPSTRLRNVLIEHVGHEKGPIANIYPNSYTNPLRDHSFGVTGIAVAPGASTVWIVGATGSVPDSSRPPIDSNLPVASGGYILSYC